MPIMKSRFLSIVFTVLVIFIPTTPWADHSPTPTAATIAGSLQDELGCPGDWQPDCAATHLTFDTDDTIWQGTFNIPAGSYEYKAALNDSWDESYGANTVANGANIQLNLGAATDVKFYYSHDTHWITDNVNSVIATVAGSFQSELGCSGDWQPDCLRSWLQDPDGDGIYTFSTDVIPGGSYECMVAHNESFNETYGAGGTAGGSNIQFTVPVGATIEFEYDPVSHILSINAAVAESGPAYAIIHYFRTDGDYGDHTTGDYNDFWGLHLWGVGIDAGEVTDWTSPKPFLGEDEYGRFAWVKLVPGATEVNFIIHRGDQKDPANSLDRQFDPSVTPEIWLKQDNGNEYVSQAEAQGFVTVHYHRDDGDYGDPTSTDYNDFWGLHLWGDAIDSSELTNWTDPKRPDGFDAYGAYFDILLQDTSQPVSFILHRGDQKDPTSSPDRGFDPLETATIWLQSQDITVYEQRGAAQDFITIHYHRDDSDYGDPTSTAYNDFWGLHAWTGAASPTEWPDPIRPAGQDQFGIFFNVDLLPGATGLAYILHRGDSKDPGADQFLDLGADGHEVWQLEIADPGNPYILPISIAGDADGDGDGDGDGVNDNDDLCPDTAPDDVVDAAGCSDAQVDGDGDGVCNDGAMSNGPSACMGIDACPETVIPEGVPTVKLGANRWALLDDDLEFDTTAPKGKGPGQSYSTADTDGCSCEQIITALDLDKGHTKHGCSISAMDEWVALP